jgi:hypothetical protein
MRQCPIYSANKACPLTFLERMIGRLTQVPLQSNDHLLLFLIPAFVHQAASLRRNPFIGKPMGIYSFHFINT